MHLWAGGQLSPLIHLQSGTPMWFRSTSCSSAAVPAKLPGWACSGCQPISAGYNGYDPGKGALLNSAAFQPLGSFCVAGTAPGCTGAYGFTGDGPRIANIRGPHGKNVDISLTKNTRIGERGNFQLRFAFFTRLTSITLSGR